MNSAGERDSSDHGEPSVVEQTIETMESLQLCVHPVHKHSFSQVSFLISGPMRKCAGCEQRLNSVFGVNQTPDMQIVRCVACYTYAHRSCAFSPEASMWKETKCPVNSALVEKEGDVESTDGSEDIMEPAVLVPEEVRPELSQLAHQDSLVHIEEEDTDMLLHSNSSVEIAGDSFVDSFEDMKAPPESPESSPEGCLSKNTNSINPVLVENGDYVMESPPAADVSEPPIIISKEEHIDQNAANDENIVHVHEEETIALLETDFGQANATLNKNVQEKEPPPISVYQFLSPPASPLTSAKEDAPETPKQTQVEEDEGIMVWTPDGPPRHWACEKSLEGISASIIHSDNETQEDMSSPEPIHYANHPFASVSRVLQENIVAYFRQSSNISQDRKEDKKVETSTLDTGAEESGEQILPEEQREGTNVGSIVVLNETDTVDPDSEVNVQSLLTEVQPQPQESSVKAIASGTLEAVKTSSQARKKLGLMSVAGGIAGGAAGLLVAGPAGAVIGAKFGQTAGVLGVILEGSVSVGVFVAGVAAASYTAQQLQQQGEKRILTIGEDKKQKVLLVRPNVVVDPIWEELCADAIRSSPSIKRGPFDILPNSAAKQAEMAKRERYRRDSDIVGTDEYEIPTEDKVLLLVSRSLNDKLSLPGHVYRCLIQKHRERCERRKFLRENDNLLNESGQSDVGGSEALAETDAKSLESPASLCDGRRDAHGVIKHVTATLLEVRPGFASSPKITEMSATAVEGLVFGELYDLVFEEIVEETKNADETLIEKIIVFERNQGGGGSDRGEKRSLHWRDGISEPAMHALQTLPEAHSAVDKLRNCVLFLELISVQFSSPGLTSDKRTTSAVNADSLLKMVCQHVIAAKVPHINAEIAFVEEFARDEHLLRGKEGYALVTMQASLHFLNASMDFENDIFQQDELEETISVQKDNSELSRR